LIAIFSASLAGGDNPRMKFPVSFFSFYFRKNKISFVANGDGLTKSIDLGKLPICRIAQPWIVML